MANIITAPESGIYFDGNTAGVADIPTLTGNASGVAIQYDGYAGIEINSSATGVDYLDRFSVEGANGRLFGVSDAVTGTVFSVNDAAGLPIIEVESTSDYDKITIGEYGTDALVISGSSVEIGGETAATRDWVTGQGYVTASSEQQTLDNVLGQGNTSSNSMSVGAISGSALDVSGDVDVTGSINVGSFTTATSSTDSYTQFDKIVLDNKFNSAANGPNRIVLHDNNAWKAGFGIHSSTHAAYSGADFAWYKTGSGPTYTQYMILNSSGNVGIGTTSPATKFHVEGDPVSTGVLAKFKGSADYGSLIQFDRGDSYNWKAGIGGGSASAGIPSSYFGIVETANTPRLVIAHTTGNVGIGTTGPSTKLDVTSGAANDARIRVKTGDSNAGAYFQARSGTDGFYGLELFHQSTAKWFIGGYGVNRLGFFVGEKSTAANEKMSLTTAGNVGIGTADPDTKLHIALAGGSAQLTLERTGGSAGKAVLAGAAEGLIVYDDAFGPKMYVGTSGTYNGNVGIGTTSPLYKLHVAGTTYVNSGTLFIDSGQQLLWGNSNQGIKGTNDTSLEFKTGGSTKMLLDNSGNVGIGTTSAEAKLHVNHGSDTGTYARFSRGTTNIDFDLGAAYAEITSTIKEFRVGTSDAQSFHLVSNDSNRLTINSSGNVGIGTTSPLRKLHVAGDIELGGGGGLYGGGTDFTYLEIANSNYHHKFFTRTNTSSSLERFTIEGGAVDGNAYFQNTNVGIGTTSPSAKLDVVGASELNGIVYVTDSNDVPLRVASTDGNAMIGISDSNSASDYANGIGVIGNDLYLDTNSVERVRITSSGSVGIGTTSPVGGKLEVQTTAGSPMLQLRPTGASTNINPLILYRSQNDGTANYLLAKNASTYFGTYNSGAPTDESDMVRITPSTSDAPILQIGDTGSTAARLDVGGNIRLLNNGDSYINGGNVGIGTVSPSAKLVVKGADSAADFADYGIVAFENQQSEGLSIGYDTGDNYTYLYSREVGVSSRGLRLNGSIYIAGVNGNVGIGTTSPAQKLHVAGTILADTSLTTSSGATAIGIAPESEIADSSSTYPVKLLSNSNNAKLTTYHYGSYLTLKAGVEASGYSNNWSKIELRDGGNPSGTTAHIKFFTSGDQRMDINDAGNVTISNDLIVSGDLTVNGTTSTINSTTVQVDDKNIELGTVATPTDTTADGGGITLKGATDKTINWYNATDAWTFSDRIAIPYGNESAPSLTFSSSTNTGIYGASTFLRLVVGGVWKASIASNGITSNGFIKEGGSSSEFLKADGSVDSSTYLTTSGKAADSDLLDGINSSSFLRSDANDTATGTYTFSNTVYFGTNPSNGGRIEIADNSTTDYKLRILGTGTRAFELQGSGSTANFLTSFTNASTGAHNISVSGSGTFSANLTVNGGGIVLGGTGRIQGIDTVSAGTDAVNKSYADTKAPLASPALTGNPTAPTPSTSDNDTSIATTAFVKAQGYITDVGGKITKKISGDGTTTTFTVTHNFGTPLVMTQLLDYGDNGTGATYEVVNASIQRSSDNAIDVLFGSAPSSSEDYLVLMTKMPAIS